MQRFSAALLVLMLECANQRMAVAAEGDLNNHDGSRVGWARRFRLCPPYGVG